MKSKLLITLVALLALFLFFTREDSFQCGQSIRYKGESYPTVLIGEKCWFDKNLNSSKNRYCYDEDLLNCDKHGGLYSLSSKRLCPRGWHISTDEEWILLERELGMAESELSLMGWRESGEVGFQLINSSGFSGVRAEDGSYLLIDRVAGWWTSTKHEDDTNLVRFLNYNSRGIDRSTEKRNSGLSVRCVKDR